MKKVLTILVLMSFITLPLPSAQAQSNLKFQKAEIDILSQGETYVPPFYKGRSLWSNQSGITLTAVPNIAGVSNTSNLFYKWTKDGTVLGTVNGVGKSSVFLTDTVLSKPQNIKIEVLSDDSAILASATFTITPRRPGALAYELSPLYGYMFHKEIMEAFALDKNEITFSIFPLFFSVPSLNNPRITYEWRTNSGEAGGGHTATYRIPEGASGTSQISTNIKNESMIFQDVKKSFLVEFGR